MRPSAAEWTLLILLGACLLALRTFRDSYLKLWVVGWAALLASRLAEHCLAAKFPAPFDQVVVQATFVLAIGLLCCAVLVYARMRDLILPLMVITPVLVGFAGARVLLWPDSLPLRVALEISYRFVLLTAAVSLLRARRGRWEPAAWLLALTLPMLASCVVSLHRWRTGWSFDCDRGCAWPEHAAGRIRRGARADAAIGGHAAHYARNYRGAAVWAHCATAQWRN